MVPELVRQNGLDFVIAVALKQRVRQNNAPRGSEAGERCIGFLRLLRQAPLVDAANPRSGAFPELGQTFAQGIILQRLELVEDRQQHHGRKLRHQQEQPDEDGPGDDPPALRRDADDGVNNLDHDRAQHQVKQPAFALVPQPAAHFLVRQMVLALEPVADDVERCAQDFGDDGEHQHVEEDSEEIMLARALVGPVAQRARPPGNQQHDQQQKADGHVGHAQPALDAVVTAYLRRISRLRNWIACGHPLWNQEEQSGQWRSR